MHDYHAVEALIERLTSAHLEGVTEVRIRAGAAFSPAALHQAYEMLTPGTALEASQLVVEPASDGYVCPGCERSWVVTSNDLVGHLLVCPSCGIPSPVDDVTVVEVISIT